MLIAKKRLIKMEKENVMKSVKRQIKPFKD